MRLGIDVREIQDGVRTGIGRALTQFLRQAAVQMPADTCVLFSERPLPVLPGPAMVSHVIDPGCPRLWWDQVRLPAALHRERIDLFYSPYPKVPLGAPCPVVSSVLDLNAYRFPQYARSRTWLQRLHDGTLGRLFLVRSSAVITCSDYSRRDIRERRGVSGARIEVVPLGVSRTFRPLADGSLVSRERESLGIRGKYLLYVGNFRPHKDVPTAFLAFAAVAGEYPELSFLLVGPPGEDAAEVMRLAGMRKLESRVVFAGVVDDEERLRVLYAGAEALIFPSRCEGFGLPPLEAMACGTPVLCADNSCLPETLDGAGVLVPAGDPEQFARALRRVLRDPAWRTALFVQGFRRAEELREDRYARRLAEIFRSLA